MLKVALRIKVPLRLPGQRQLLIKNRCCWLEVVLSHILPSPVSLALPLFFPLKVNAPQRRAAAPTSCQGLDCTLPPGSTSLCAQSPAYWTFPHGFTIQSVQTATHDFTLPVPLPRISPPHAPVRQPSGSSCTLPPGVSKAPSAAPRPSGPCPSAVRSSRPDRLTVLPPGSPFPFVYSA